MDDDTEDAEEKKKKADADRVSETNAFTALCQTVDVVTQKVCPLRTIRVVCFG
jgi:hypothetical protein